MADSKFDLGDYVEVKDRIRILYEFFPQARVVTDYTITDAPDAKPKVIARAEVYRQPDDDRPAATGTSWLYLPGSTAYTRGSEVENAETSAVGRAIGMLGILIDKSLASRNEVEAKAGSSSPIAEPTVGSLIGVVEVGKTSDTDFEYRPDPQGIAQVGFVLVEGRKRQKVHATGELAEDLMVVRENLMGQRATCWGNLRAETFRPANATRDVTYYVLDLERITSGAIALPVNREAPSVPMFDAEAERELDAIA